MRLGESSRGMGNLKSTSVSVPTAGERTLVRTVLQASIVKWEVNCYCWSVSVATVFAVPNTIVEVEELETSFCILRRIRKNFT